MTAIDNLEAQSANERELTIQQLVRIDGIARKTAEILYEIGIRGFARLAAYLRAHTADEVSADFLAHGLKRSSGLIKLEAWIQQAELFAQAETPSSAAAQPASTPSAEANSSSSASESLDHDAVFTVFFDLVTDEDGNSQVHTTVYDEKNGGKEKLFKDTQASEWVSWMLEQAHLPPGLAQMASEIAGLDAQPPAQAEAATTIPPGGSFKAQIEIQQIEVNPRKSATHSSEKMLSAEIIFRLSGADAETLASQSMPYRVEIYTIEFGSGAPRFVASGDGRLAPRRSEYTHRLEFAMPAVGRYELHSLVRLPPSGGLKGYHQGPVIRILP